MSSALGVAGHALLLDCRSLAVKPIPLPAGTAVLVIDSKIQRGLVDSEYNLRRQQCEAAAVGLGVKALRDVDDSLWSRRGGELDLVVRRRARHIISDSRRCELLALALAQGDLREMGRLMRESHWSMRDDFEITVPAIDGLAALVQDVIGDAGGAADDGWRVWRLRHCVGAAGPGRRDPLGRGQELPLAGWP
jgi:galactokinase